MLKPFVVYSFVVIVVIGVKRFKFGKNSFLSKDHLVEINVIVLVII